MEKETSLKCSGAFATFNWFVPKGFWGTMSNSHQDEGIWLCCSHTHTPPTNIVSSFKVVFTFPHIAVVEMFYFSPLLVIETLVIRIF